MHVFINGERFTFDVNEQVTLVVEQALAKFLSAEQQQTTFAVAVNSEFVGRDEYATLTLKAGDSIDVLFPIQGG